MSTVTITKPQQSKYTEAEIREGLTVLALCSGNYRRAGRELRERGVQIPDDTLRKWKDHTHKGSYQQIVEQELPQVYAAIAERCEDLALEQAEVEAVALEKLRQDLPSMDGRDVSNALRNLATSKAINIDKASVVRGRPTEIREDRTLVEVARSLNQYAGVVKVTGEVVESTAQELPSAPVDAPQAAAPMVMEGSRSAHASVQRSRVESAKPGTEQ